MNEADEKFFEALAGQKADAGAEYEAELAKAKSSLVKAETANAVVPRSGQFLKKTVENDLEGEPEGQLTLDVYQTPSEIIVESAIAGVKPEDVDINVSNDSIAIKGERYRENEVKDGDYFYQECYWGKFSRSVILPQEVDPANATVSFKNGILTVRLPKLNRKKSRKLKVKVE